MHGPKSEIISISTEQDVVTVRKKVRERAIDINLSMITLTKVVTAASELARNVIKYAQHGTLELIHLKDNSQEGLQLVFNDEGPGIADVPRVLTGGYTTGGGLGLGLSGSKKLANVFEIKSELGKGTNVKLIFWK